MAATEYSSLDEIKSKNNEEEMILGHKLIEIFEGLYSLRLSFDEERSRFNEEEDNDVIIISDNNNKRINTSSRNQENLLIKNDRNSRINLHGNDGFYIDRNTFYYGLTNILKNNFWPNTSDDPYLKSAEQRNRKKMLINNQKEEKITIKYVPSNLKKSQYCKMKAKSHGSIIHSEISTFIELLNQCYDQNKLLSNNNNNNNNNNDSGNGNFDYFIHTLLKQKISAPDPCSISLLKSLIGLNLVPIQSEFKIWHEEWFIATSADIIAKNKFGKLFLIEVKTGYEDEPYDEIKEDKCLFYPFDNVKDCPKNRHLIQLLLTRYILNEKYNIEFEKCFILHRKPRLKTIDKIELNDKWANKIYSTINEYLKINANSRRKN